MPDENSMSQIKNEDQYEALREKGMSKQKAARIANSESESKGGKSKKYEEWTKKELYNKAGEIGVEGRSKMNKKELIDSLRNN